MSEEDRTELKKELSVYSKVELLEKYIDELEENCTLSDLWCKSSQRINSAIEYLEQPNRDNFDFSKARLLEILDKENKWKQ